MRIILKLINEDISLISYGLRGYPEMATLTDHILPTIPRERINKDVQLPQAEE